MRWVLVALLLGQPLVGCVGPIGPSNDTSPVDESGQGGELGVSTSPPSPPVDRCFGVTSHRVNWTQPGLFDAMPTAGMYQGIEVVHDPAGGDLPAGEQGTIVGVPAAELMVKTVRWVVPIAEDRPEPHEHRWAGNATEHPTFTLRLVHEGDQRVARLGGVFPAETSASERRALFLSFASNISTVRGDALDGWAERFMDARLDAYRHETDVETPLRLPALVEDLGLADQPPAVDSVWEVKLEAEGWDLAFGLDVVKAGQRSDEGGAGIAVGARDRTSFGWWGPVGLDSPERAAAALNETYEALALGTPPEEAWHGLSGQAGCEPDERS